MMFLCTYVRNSFRVWFVQVCLYCIVSIVIHFAGGRLFNSCCYLLFCLNASFFYLNIFAQEFPHVTVSFIVRLLDSIHLIITITTCTTIIIIVVIVKSIIRSCCTIIKSSSSSFFVLPSLPPPFLLILCQFCRILICYLRLCCSVCLWHIVHVCHTSCVEL